MGGRGAELGVGGSLYNRTKQQDKTVRQIAKKTANLKKEQYRIVAEDGSVPVVSKGAQHEVGTKIGDKRQYMSGSVSIHNHPEGGTFSPDDLNDFGFGAKEIVAATPEGTYRLINARYGGPKQYDGWVKLRDALNASDAMKEVSGLELLKKAQANKANTAAAKQMRAISNKWDSLRQSKGLDAANQYMDSVRTRYEEASRKHKEEVAKERRRLEVQPVHDFYKANAKKYGFIYKFEGK